VRFARRRNRAAWSRIAELLKWAGVRLKNRLLPFADIGFADPILMGADH
jgi:hypothetical protein